MTLVEFATVYAMLAVQLRHTDVDALSVKAYFTVLKDLPLPAIQASARALAVEPGRRFFPTTAEWHQVAQDVTVEALRKALPAAREAPWTHDCHDCQDTGWAPYTCPGDVTCGRQAAHAAHPYVRACPCRASNRTWQRHQAVGAGV